MCKGIEENEIQKQVFEYIALKRIFEKSEYSGAFKRMMPLFRFWGYGGNEETHPSEPDNQEEKVPGDRVEIFRPFGKATADIGTVKKTNEDEAVVKWDDYRRTRRLQSPL